MDVYIHISINCEQHLDHIIQSIKFDKRVAKFMTHSNWPQLDFPSKQQIIYPSQQSVVITLHSQNNCLTPWNDHPIYHFYTNSLTNRKPEYWLYSLKWQNDLPGIISDGVIKIKPCDLNIESSATKFHMYIISFLK